jgi:hypothetical protein
MPIFMIGNILEILIMMDVMIMLLIVIHMLCLHPVPPLFMVEVGLGEIMLCIMRLEKCAMNLLLFFMLATLCWGEGEDATLRSSHRLSRCANGS